MEIISKEEFGKLPSKRGRTSEIMKCIDQLEVGQALVINKEDWIAKSRPTNLILQNFRNSRSSKKFVTRTLLEDKGWAVLRIQ
jgi:hypothetical protein